MLPGGHLATGPNESSETGLVDIVILAEAEWLRQWSEDVALRRINCLDDTVEIRSMRIISEASFATSVPAMPMENSTSAVFSEGPLLVPSAMTATVSPWIFSLSTKRARTSRRGMMASISWSESCRKKVRLSMTTQPSVLIPHSVAISWSVTLLSSVAVRTLIPALWHLRTASVTWGRRGAECRPDPPGHALQTSGNLAMDGSSSSVAAPADGHCG